MNLVRRLSVCAAWYDIVSIRESWEYAPWVAVLCFTDINIQFQPLPRLGHAELWLL